MMTKTWWKEAVIYQIYPRSFKDSNGDGIGDLPGIISKLDYLQELGVNLIWMSPVFKSPNADNGYDISDYRDIMDEFGTLDDISRLIEEAHQRGIRILLDVVLNHTSDEHEWFKHSRSSKDNPYRDYYFWRDGRNGGAPNNWTSFFEGSAWELDEVTQQYYLHYFVTKQPDLNWEHPPVREEMVDLLRFWLDRGVDGFRLDVLPLISKRTAFQDTPHEVFLDTITNVYANGPRLHEFLSMLHERVWSDYDCFTMGEGIGVTASQVSEYVDESRKELNTIYHFDHLFLNNGPGGKFDVIPVDYQKFQDIFFEWDKALGESGWGVLCLGNHDFGRMTTHFGSAQFREASAKLLLTVLMTLRGTPILYMGDELGMVNTHFDSIDQIDDVQTRNSYHAHVSQGGDPDAFLAAANVNSRDHVRTPMPWSSEHQGGFTNGSPWLDLNPNFGLINVEDQRRDPNSVLSYCQKLIHVRRSSEVLTYGRLERVLSPAAHLFAYCRKTASEEVLVVHNMSDNQAEFPMPSAVTELILTNGEEVVIKHGNVLLAPWQSAIWAVHN